MKLDRWGTYGIAGITTAAVVGVLAHFLKPKSRAPVEDEGKYDRGHAEMMATITEEERELFEAAFDGIDYFLRHCDDLAIVRRFCDLEASAITLEMNLDEAARQMSLLMIRGLPGDPEIGRVLRDCDRYVDVFRKYQQRRRASETLV